MNRIISAEVEGGTEAWVKLNEAFSSGNRSLVVNRTPNLVTEPAKEPSQKESASSTHNLVALKTEEAKVPDGGTLSAEQIDSATNALLTSPDKAPMSAEQIAAIYEQSDDQKKKSEPVKGEGEVRSGPKSCRKLKMSYFLMRELRKRAQARTLNFLKIQ